MDKIKLSWRSIPYWALVALFSLIWLYYPTLSAKFALIDDHIIPSFSPLIVEENGRLRPFYWIFYAGERWICGVDSPFPWHLNRLLCATFVFVCLYQASRFWLDPAPSAVVALIFFNGPQYWTWVELGPAEVYSMLLLAPGLYLLSRATSLAQHRPYDLKWGFLLVALSGLAKESFVLLMPGLFVAIELVARQMQVKRLPWRKRDFCTTALLVVLACSNLAAILVVVKTYGHIYAEDTSVGRWKEYPKIMMAFFGQAGGCLPLALTLCGLAANALANHPRTWQRRLAVACVGLHFVFISLRFSPSSPRGYLLLAMFCLALALSERITRHQSLELLTLLLLPGVFLVAHLAVYGSGTDISYRYYLPGNLCVVLLTAIGFYFLPKVWGQAATKIVPLVGLLMLAQCLIPMKGRQRDIIQNYVSRTYRLQAFVEQVALQAEATKAAVVIAGVTPFDEPVFSVAGYLSRRLEAPRMYVWVQPMPKKLPGWASEAYSKVIHDKLTEVSRLGDGLFRPWSDLISGGDEQVILITIDDTDFFENVEVITLAELLEGRSHGSQ